MTDEQRQFLQAIFDNPDDDVVRLVYADWLEENTEDGWKRAAYIRYQINPDKPITFDYEFLEIFPECRRVPFSIWFMHGNKQILGIRSGFIESIEMTGDDWLRYADVLTAWHPIREVTLTTFPDVSLVDEKRLYTFAEKWPSITFRFPE